MLQDVEFPLPALMQVHDFSVMELNFLRNAVHMSMLSGVIGFMMLLVFTEFFILLLLADINNKLVENLILFKLRQYLQRCHHMVDLIFVRVVTFMLKVAFLKSKFDKYYFINLESWHHKILTKTPS